MNKKPLYSNNIQYFQDTNNFYSRQSIIGHWVLSLNLETNIVVINDENALVQYIFTV